MAVDNHLWFMQSIKMHSNTTEKEKNFAIN